MLVIIIVGVVTKIILGRYVKSVGVKMNSASLINSGEDATLDSIISASTLVAAVIYLLFHISLEAYLGAVISIIIIKSAIEMLRDSLSDILESLPAYTTTGVTEPRAVLHIQTKDHSVLKRHFQKIFEEEWKAQKVLLENYGIYGWECDITNGTKETLGETDFSKSGKGGLKIKFLDRGGKPSAFIWMRGSGTEPVFRIMCDVKGNNPELEKALLSWETEMLLEADKISE